MKVIDRILEHLITKEKYNTVKLKLDVKKEEYDEKVIQLKNLRKENARLKKEIKEMKKNV